MSDINKPTDTDIEEKVTVEFQYTHSGDMSKVSGKVTGIKQEKGIGYIQIFDGERSLKVTWTSPDRWMAVVRDKRASVRGGKIIVTEE